MGSLHHLHLDATQSVAPPVAAPDWIVDAIEHPPAARALTPRRLLVALVTASIAVGGVAGLAVAGQPAPAAATQNSGPGVAAAPPIVGPADAERRPASD